MADTVGLYRAGRFQLELAQAGFFVAGVPALQDADGTVRGG